MKRDSDIHLTLFIILTLLFLILFLTGCSGVNSHGQAPDQGDYGLIFVMYSALEFLIGIDRSMKSNSLIELILNILKDVFEKITKE